jgi:hypothetical protein
MAERYVAEPHDEYEDERWRVKDTLTGLYTSGHEGPDAMASAHDLAQRRSEQWAAELKLAHEEAFMEEWRRNPPPSSRYQVVSDWYATLVVDEVDNRVVAQSRGDTRKKWAEGIAARLNEADARRADHERRKQRYGTCTSRRWYLERYRFGWWPVRSRCSWPADHQGFSKWHCAEDTTERVWEVADEEREGWE